MIYHVSKYGNNHNDGSELRPFLTISKAARTACEGDTVIVHEGEYRECVSPENGGRSNNARVVYTAAEGERVIIKGSEQIKDWERTENGIWRASISNAVFGSYNPYEEPIDGDWLMSPLDPPLHTGQVYINGEALSEVKGLNDAAKNEMSWFAEVGDNETVIYANFADISPSGALVEINVRKSCFYPQKTGIDYITVRGFEMAHAASPWAPPTADQPGMLGAHWSKGWIIENNILHDARCSAISVGKEISTGHNSYNQYHRKPGYQTQLEVVFTAIKSGWSKEKIGGHIIRNNTIYNCGQNGIVGHMGGAFSEIYGNHIYNIGIKHEFFGFEIAGIKLHAALDTQIHHNCIHDCTFGTWLDWQTQGTRVSKNIYFDNETDLFVEVSHGPYLADNNVFGSRYSLRNVSQGGAFVHHLFCGAIRRHGELRRGTPYHTPHSSDIKGTALIYGGDDRFYNNIFANNVTCDDDISSCGTASYNGSPASMEEYIKRVLANGKGDVETFVNVTQPAYINHNYYADGIDAFDGEEDKHKSKTPSDARVYIDDNCVYLKITAEKAVLKPEVITTKILGMPRISEAPYENPDGTELRIDTDLLDNVRSSRPSAGPIENLKTGAQNILLWRF